jgi:hypothetical protein
MEEWLELKEKEKNEEEKENTEEIEKIRSKRYLWGEWKRVGDVSLLHRFLDREEWKERKGEEEIENTSADSLLASRQGQNLNLNI